MYVCVEYECIYKCIYMYVCIILVVCDDDHCLICDDDYTICKDCDNGYSRSSNGECIRDGPPIIILICE